MYPILSKDAIKAAVNGSPVAGVILCQSYTTQLTKKGDEYISGTLQSCINVPFKAWNRSVAFTTFKNGNFIGKPVYITGKWDNYGGSLSLVIDTVMENTEYTTDQFFPLKYNIEAYLDSLKKQVALKASEKGMQLANMVLFENDELLEKFKSEFAAQSHHDNCKGGLLAHTYKVVSTVNYLLNMYPVLVKDDNVPNQDVIDVLVLGALFHDIGKTREMKFGVYQPESIVTHRYLGIEMLYPYRDWVINNYSEEWWLNLVSIFLQHHGEFDDKCRTLVAYIVHQADILDAYMTDLCQALESMTTDTTGNKIRVNGQNLNV